jgi:tRNA(fMet)-specific endonuclease VapC
VIFIDSNIVIYALKGLYGLKEKFLEYKPSNIKIPSIVKAELMHGAYKSSDVKKSLKLVNQFLSPFEIISFTDEATEIYGKIRSDIDKTKQKNEIIKNNDMLIAATVLSLNGTLITNDKKDFNNIENLRIETWV